MTHFIRLEKFLTAIMNSNSLIAFSFQHQPLDLSISRREEFPPSENVTKLISNELDNFARNIYTPQSICRAVYAIEEEFKKDYVKPDNLHCRNQNMARKFPKTKSESIEQRRQKFTNAQVSRNSRYKIKFMRKRIEKENQALDKILHEHIKRLVNLECYVNECLMEYGKPLIDWRCVWDDDAYGEDEAEADYEKQTDDDLRKTSENVTSMHDQPIENNNQPIINTDKTMSTNDDASIYDSHTNSTCSGDDKACKYAPINKRRRKESK